MAEVKGLSIIVCGDLMAINAKEIAAANDYLSNTIGIANYKNLDPDGWYDTKIYGEFMDIMARSSATKDYAYVMVGKRIYPRLKKLGMLPETLKTPFENILFEAQGFLLNHRGFGVEPRKFIYAKEGDVLVYAPAPAYNKKLYEGIFIGILDMCGVKTGKVAMKPDNTFHITW